MRPDAEERRVPQHQVGELARLDRADLAVDAVGDRRADRVLGDVAAGPLVVGRRRRRPATRAAPSSRARSARCAARPRRPGPSPGSPSRSSRSRRGRAAGPRRRSWTAGSGSRRTPGPPARAVSRWWQTISMSRCSSRVFTVCGRVGLVGDGSTLGCPATVMMSGACPPPAPSVWYAWMLRPAIAARVSSTKPASFRVSVWIATWTPVLAGHRQAGVDRRRRRAPVLVQLEAAGAGPQLLPQRLPATRCCPCRAARR